MLKLKKIFQVLDRHVILFLINFFFFCNSHATNFFYNLMPAIFGAGCAVICALRKREFA